MSARSLLFQFTVTPDEAPAFDVAADSRDVVLWERATGKALSSFDDEGVSMETMYHLAYLAARRKGLFVLPEGVANDGPAGVEHMIQTCRIDVHDEDGEGEGLDPTQPAASTEPR